MQNSTIIKTTIDEYIDMQQTSTVFIDAKVFSNKYIPTNLLYRNEEIKYILSNITKPFQDIEAQNMYIYGPPGTGKTVTFKIAINDLNEKAEQTGQKIKYIYTNVKYKTLSQALDDIVRQVKKVVPVKGLGFNDYVQMIKTSLGDHHTGIIVDDLDKMISKYPYTNPIDILVNTLSRFSESGIKIFLCALVNDRTIENRFKPSTRSAYAPQYLNFRAYNASELSDILKDRCAKGLKKDAYEGETINNFGQFLVSTRRDLRTGFYSIREAGYQVNHEGRTKIEEQDLQNAIKKVEQDTLAESISKLDETTLTFLYSIAHTQKNQKEAKTEETYDFYIEQVTNFKISHTCEKSHILRNICPYLEIMGFISSYRQGHRTKGVARIFYITTEELNSIYKLCKQELNQHLKEAKCTEDDHFWHEGKCYTISEAKRKGVYYKDETKNAERTTLENKLENGNSN